MTLKDFLHENLDWWLVAQNSDAFSEPIHGREI